MSGGAWEYVMANYNNISASSGFSNPLTLDSKYYNLYTSNNINTACNGSECISHGLGETGNWYGDHYTMVSEEYPWFVGGGGFYTWYDAGVFAIGPSTNGIGGVGNNYSFRLVISPNI